MRGLRYMIPMLVMLLFMASCARRPFADYNSKVKLSLNINTDIQNHEVTKLPENMRVDLYDPATGEHLYTDYVGPEGGYIHPDPGIYDLIVYSIGSETTIVHNEHHFNEIEAYTNEVMSYLKSQTAENQTKEGESEHPIVYEPEHIFVGWHQSLEVPVALEDEEIQEILVEIDAHTIVETWQVEIRNVEGTQYVSELSGIACGQRGSVHIGPNVASERVVRVIFEMKLEDKGSGGKCIKGKYSSFGVHEEQTGTVYLDLSVGNKGGGSQYFRFDVTDQMKGNEQRYILIDDPVVIEESGGGGGGFQPIVDDWDDIHTDIKL